MAPTCFWTVYESRVFLRRVSVSTQFWFGIGLVLVLSVPEYCWSSGRRVLRLSIG